MVIEDIRAFFDELSYQDNYALCNGQKIFFNGCQYKIDDNGKVISSVCI